MESTATQFNTCGWVCYLKYFHEPQFLTVPKEGRESLVYMPLISTFGKQRLTVSEDTFGKFQDGQC